MAFCADMLLGIYSLAPQFSVFRCLFFHQQKETDKFNGHDET